MQSISGGSYSLKGLGLRGDSCPLPLVFENFAFLHESEEREWSLLLLEERVSSSTCVATHKTLESSGEQGNV